jgi:hypothetical protein
VSGRGGDTGGRRWTSDVLRPRLAYALAAAQRGPARGQFAYPIRPVSERGPNLPSVTSFLHERRATFRSPPCALRDVRDEQHDPRAAEWIE